jgi:cobalt-precorrin-7 (C5)-methyltransferase
MVDAVKIVGVGAGPEMLTEEAIKAIEGANVVYGSARAIELAKAHIRGEVRVLTNFDLFEDTEDVCVLSTGDPMLSGLGKKAPNDAEIISGISSLQLACARQKVDIADTLRTLSTLGRMLFVLPDPSFDLGKICTFLDACGYKGDVVLFEDLGYERERITVGSIHTPPKRTSALFCALINPKISHG